jgi:hypothetical protein
MKSENQPETNIEPDLSPLKSSTSDDVCIPNISRPEQRKRLMSGVVMLLVALAILAALLVFGVSRWWRLILFPLFAGAGSGYFQWRDKT